MKGIEPLTYRVLSGNSTIEPHSHINPLFSFTLRAVNLTLFIHKSKRIFDINYKGDGFNKNYLVAYFVLINGSQVRTS